MLREINFNSAGFAFLEISIKPRHSTTMESVTCKVDSGADCTTISAKRLLELGYDENWICSGKPLFGSEAPTAASGLPIDGCYEVILPEINIGDWVGYNWPVLTSLNVPLK